MIDYREEEDTEKLIAQIIANKEFKYSKFEIKDFPKNELAREMTDREKALLTIVIQIGEDIENTPRSMENILEHELLMNHLSFYQNSLNFELISGNINLNRIVVFCKDGKLYYAEEGFLKKCDESKKLILDP